MAWEDGSFVAEPEITCVDCGGVAHLLTKPPGPDDLPWAEGDLVVYRCQDCNDRWDLEVPADDGRD
jgi:hypothetical protein